MEGTIRKMRVENNSPIDYYLRLSEEEIHLNTYLGKEIELSFSGNIYCKKCGKKIKKSFQGFCFDHFQNAPEAAECIIRPELCKGHLGEGRDPEWEKEHHVQPHVVYFANSGGMKVGVTRDTQIPTRWIDQGATEAIILARTGNRYEAGMIEIDMMQYLSDKTQWQKMLTEDFEYESIKDARSEYKDYIDPSFSKFILEEEQHFKLNFPIVELPKAPKSHNFDKDAVFAGKLKGIKGQYLILEDDKVVNIRRYEGYEMRFNT